MLIIKVLIQYLNKMSQRIKLPMLVGAVLLLSVGRAVEPVVFDYKNNGLDWPDRWAQCG